MAGEVTKWQPNSLSMLSIVAFSVFSPPSPFDPSGRSLYVVDFGVLTMSEAGSKPRTGTGALWSISRTGGL